MNIWKANKNIRINCLIVIFQINTLCQESIFNMTNIFSNIFLGNSFLISLLLSICRFIRFERDYSSLIHTHSISLCSIYSQRNLFLCFCCNNSNNYSPLEADCTNILSEKQGWSRSCESFDSDWVWRFKPLVLISRIYNYSIAQSFEYILDNFDPFLMIF